jgi:predicted HD phosphohydrolase
MSGFRRLDQSDGVDWQQICSAHVRHYAVAGPLRIMDQLRSLGELGLGFPCDQLQHSLMTATLARAADADDETVIVALCHDIGKTFSVPNHAAIGAEILKPYVSDDHYRAVFHHQEFQGRYYFNHFGESTTMRDAYQGESWYALAEALVDEWDMPAFDPDFAADPLESFEPAVIRVFSAPRMM